MLEIRRWIAVRTYENTFFREFSKNLSKLFLEKNIDWLLIWNWFCEEDETLQIDALLICWNSISIIDFKNYWGKIFLPNEYMFEHSIWKTNTNEIIKWWVSINPFVQLKKQKNKLIGLINNFLIKNLGEWEYIDPTHIKRIVCFQQNISLEWKIPWKNQLDFFITDNLSYKNLIEDIIAVNDKWIKIYSKESYDFFKKKFKADDFKIDIIDNYEYLFSEWKNLKLDNLTSNQKDAINNIISFFHNDNEQIFILDGTSKSWKTYLIEFIEDVAFKNKFKEVEKLVISKRLSRQEYINFKSLYSLIYWWKKWIEENNIEIIPLKENDNEEQTLYIVDRAELISDLYNESFDMRFWTGKLLKDFLEFVNIEKSKRKIIFIWDNFLLNSWMYNKSGISMNYLKDEYWFEKIWYFCLDDNYERIFLWEKTIQIVNYLRNKVYNFLNFDEKGLNFENISSEKVKNIIAEKIINNKNFKIITYKNSTANNINLWIKRNIIKNQSTISIWDLVVVNNNLKLFSEDPFDKGLEIFNWLKVLDFISDINNFSYIDKEWKTASFYEVLASKILNNLTKEGNLLKYKKSLFLYLKLKNKRPSKIHSWVLIYTLNKFKKDENFAKNFDFIEFISLWWDKNFLKDDFEEKEFEWKKLISTFEKVFSIFWKNIENMNPQNQSIYYNIFSKWESLLYKRSNYYFAKYFLKLKDYFNSEKYIIKTVKAEKKQPWAWHLLAEFFKQKKDDTNYFSCLAKVLSLWQKEDFLWNYRKEFAEILISKKFFQEASIEINLIIQNKKENNYKIKEDILDLIKGDWYNENLLWNNKKFYDKYKILADNFLVKDIKDKIILIKHINKEKNILGFIDSSWIEWFFELWSYKNKKINLFDLLFVKVENISWKKFILYKILEKKPVPEDFFKDNKLVYIYRINKEKNIFNFLFKDWKIWFWKFWNFNIRVWEIKKINLIKKEWDFYQINYIFDNNIDKIEFTKDIKSEKIFITKIDFINKRLNFVNEFKSWFFDFSDFEDKFKFANKGDTIFVKILKIKENNIYKLIEFDNLISNSEKNISWYLIMKSNFWFIDDIFISGKILKEFLEFNNSNVDNLESLEWLKFKILYKDNFDFSRSMFSKTAVKIFNLNDIPKIGKE